MVSGGTKCEIEALYSAGDAERNYRFGGVGAYVRRAVEAGDWID